MTILDFITARLNDDTNMDATAKAYRSALGTIVNVHHEIPDIANVLRGYRTGETMCHADGMAWPCATLRIIAAAWAEHPGWQPEWAVTSDAVQP